MAAKEREVAVEVIRRLQAAGYQAVLAGGCVRDEFLGREPKDYDIATSAMPEQSEAVVKAAGGSIVPIGRLYAIVVAIFNGVTLEIATLRGNEVFGNGNAELRLGVSLRDDAARRDLTLNAMFLDPLSGEYFDFFGGREDLRHRTIRSVGNPHARLKEDRRRLMRAIRFAAQFGFSIHPSLTSAIRDEASSLMNTSAERIRDEFELILTGADPVLGMRLLKEHQLLSQFLPEVDCLDGPLAMQDSGWHPEGTVWEHVLLMLDLVKGQTFPLLFGVTLHDIGKPATQKRLPSGRITNFNHENVGAEMVPAIGKRLRLERSVTEHVKELVALHTKMHYVERLRPGKLCRLLEHPHIQDLIELQHADAMGNGMSPEQRESKSRRAFLQRKLAEFATVHEHAPQLLNGEILKELGFKPGPLFKEILAEALDAQREGVFDDSGSAKAWVVEKYGAKRQ